MRKIKLSFYALTALIVFAGILASCSVEKTNGYTINGTTDWLKDGDKIMLTDGDGNVLDTIVVKNGKFTYSGKSDSVGMYSLYPEKDSRNDINFFNEQGTINIFLANPDGKSTVGGTVSNDANQELNDVTAPIIDQMTKIGQAVAANPEMSSEEERALGEKYMQLFNDVQKKVREAAEKNVDNEFGFMLITTYIDEKEQDEFLRNIIGKIPEAFRSREKMKNLEERLAKSESIREGKKIADFTMSTPDGEQLSVLAEAAKNRVTILDFWASWCGPCRQEMPFMKDMYKELNPKGLGIIGISLDDSAKEWKQAIDALALPWTHISDLKGWSSSAAQTFQVNAIPFLMVIDSEGTILKKGLRGEELKEYVKSLLN